MKKKITVVVKSARHQIEYYIFTFLIKETNRIGLRKIEKEFYIKHSKSHSVPRGKHHEIEIIEPNMVLQKNHEKIHFHLSAKDDKPYICWTRRVPNMDRALDIITIWSAGTVYTMKNNIGFEKLSSNDDLDNDIFENVMNKLKRYYKITVETVLEEIYSRV
ncbi:MAG: hypothetical protein QY321_04000 [Patescibacteria group bacterium]|nr:MAG: hypothetical protein QY321_04000 [Patescibacteria group bacterium]